MIWERDFFWKRIRVKFTPFSDGVEIVLSLSKGFSLEKRIDFFLFLDKVHRCRLKLLGTRKREISLIKKKEILSWGKNAFENYFSNTIIKKKTFKIIQNKK